LELLRSLDDGWEVTFKNQHYATTRDGLDGAKLWPSTFYGLFDGRLVERLTNGNYTISSHGKQKMLSILETETVAGADEQEADKKR